jgi:hypothetical protein
MNIKRPSMNYDVEKTNLIQISKHLELMKIPFIFQDIGEIPEEKFPAIACTYRHNQIDFDVIIYSIGDWINVKALIMDLHQYSSDIALQTYETCLNLNFELPETTFSAFNQRLYVEMDCLVEVDHETFQSEFQSIAEGINQFMERMYKKHNLQLINTKGQSGVEIRIKNPIKI